MVKKDAAPFLFVGAAALGVSILAITVDYVGLAILAVMFTIGGFGAAALEQWPGKERTQRKSNFFDVLADGCRQIADAPIVSRVLLGLALLWVLATAGWILLTDPLWLTRHW